jgi:hypothetical protein
MAGSEGTPTYRSPISLRGSPAPASTITTSRRITWTSTTTTQVPLLRLPQLCELFVLEPLLLQLQPVPDRHLRRLLLLPLSLLQQPKRGDRAALPSGPPLRLQGLQRAGDYITRERQRPSNEGRRITERDRTSADVGGRGSIPAPVDPRRRVSGNSGTPGSQPDNGQSNPRRRTGDTGTTTDQPGNPSQPEPRRRDDNTTTRPNIQPRAQPNTDPASDRRQQPDRKSDLRETDSQRPPERRGTDDRSTTGRQSTPDSRSTQEPSRRTDPGSDSRGQPNVQPRAEPQRNQPSPEPRRAEPSRAEPQRPEPSRSQPPPRVQSPPPSRGQPTGEPSLRRRKPD